MLQESIMTADTDEQAKAMACEELGKSVDEVQTEVLEKKKKGLFGKLKNQAKVRVFYEEGVSKLAVAQKYLTDALHGLGLTNIQQTVTEEENYIRISLEGENLGVAIGRRGETLDALQYLVSLVANRSGGDYARIVIDSGNFREKREETLRELAKKIAAQVLRSGRSSALEPMNPYERRIIHATVSEIDGVYSKSVGDDPNRRVIIASENPKKSSYRKPSGNKNGNRGGRNGNRDRRDNRERRNRYDSNYEAARPISTSPATYDFEKEFLRSESTAEKEVKLYSKIETEE